MASFNRIILLGNLTRDPQLSYLPSQTPVVEFGLATNRRWTGSDGQQREETCFVDCRAYGKQAEILSKYLSKGRAVMIEGRLTLDQWEGPDGSKRSKHRVTVENFTFVDSRDGNSNGGAGSGGGRRAPAGGYGGNQPAPNDGGNQDTGGYGDDIPF